MYWMYYTEREYEEARSDAGQRRGPRNHRLFRAKPRSRGQPNWRGEGRHVNSGISCVLTI